MVLKLTGSTTAELDWMSSAASDVAQAWRHISPGARP